MIGALAVDIPDVVIAVQTVAPEGRAALVREIATRLGDAERLRREGAAAQARIAGHFNAPATSKLTRR